MPKLEPYSHRLPYSYALGIFPAMMLLEARPDRARRLLVHPAADDSEGLNRLRERCRELGVREELAERVLKRESRKDNCFAALVFEKFESELDGSLPHAVLCQISDSGNVGTALRSLLGFGIRDVALIRPCVDVFEPHVLRASMGAFYKMRVHTFDSFDEYRATVPGRPLYPFMLDGAIPLEDAAAGAKSPFSLVFGNEASGLPAEFAQMGQSVFIPQSPEIDSLNLAVAVSVGAYQFMRGHRDES